jgi:hypothetical protein
MDKFTTHVHLIASGNDLDNDLPYLEKIMEAIYSNYAILTRDWLGAAIARKKRMPHVEKGDWVSIVSESIDAIKRSDLIIAEISFSDFNQGVQTYIAAQYKKPTLIVTRSQIEDRFISGISNKYLTVKRYATIEELESIVNAFIKQHAVPSKALRFNLFLDRRIYKYLRDKSYETGKNKSEIVRALLEKEVRRRNET